MASFALSLAVGLASRAVLSVFTPSREIESSPRDVRGPKAGFDQPIPKVYGRVRLGCSYLWAPKVRVEEEEQSQGKGGSSPQNTTYNYFADFACWACEGEVNFRKIWLNGNLAWESSDGNTFSESKEIAAFNQDEKQVEFTSDLSNSSYEGATISYPSSFWRATFDSEVQVTRQIDANTLEIESALLLPTVGDTATITQEGGDDTQLNATPYPGSLTQTPDSLIESVEGAGETPAFRGLAYFVIDDLNLEDYGLGFPQSVEAEVESVSFPAPTLQEVIEDVCDEVGLLSEEYDASALSGISVTGAIYKRDGGSAREFLQELQKLYFFYPIYADGKIKFIPQTQPKTANILKPDLQSQGYTQRLIQPSNIPYEVQVSYFNQDDNYQRGVQYARREGRRDNTERIESQVVLTDDRAKSIAQQLLTQFWIQRRQYEDIKLLPSWLGLNAGDIVTIPIDSRSPSIQVTKIDIGANLQLDIEATLYSLDGGDTTTTIADDTPSSSGQYTYTPAPAPPLTGIKAQSRPFEANLRSSQDSEMGIYCAIAAASSKWSNGALYASIDTNSNYKQVAPILGKSYTGQCTNDPSSSLLPAQWNGDEIIDTATTLNIELINGTLSSVPQIKFDNNELVLLVGNEYIGVRDAVLNSGVYECSHLKRGLFGTENAIAQHTANETCYVMRGEGAAKIVRIAGTKEYIGRTLYIKAVAQGQSVDTVTQEASITIQGTSLKPFAPIKVSSSVDEGNNISLSWEARSRGDGLTLGEEETRYEIEILDSVGTGAGNVLRTLVATSNSINYTAAQQTADFGSVVGQTASDIDLDVVVYKLSTLAGNTAVTSDFFRGYPAVVYPVPLGGTVAGITWNAESEEFKGELTYSANASASLDQQGKWLRFEAASGDLTYTLDNTLPVGFHAYVYVTGGNTLDLVGANSAIGETNIASGKTALIVHRGNGNWIIDTDSGGSGGVSESDIIEITSSRNVQDSDRGNVISTNSSSDLTVTADATQLTGPDKFTFTVNRKGVGKAIISFTQSISAKGVSSGSVEIVSVNGAASFIYDSGSSTWYGWGDLITIDTGSGDMSKSTYDADDDGIVDLAEDVAGSPTASQYYGTDSNGNKGFYDLPSGGSSDPNPSFSGAITPPYTIQDSDNLAHREVTGTGTITIPDTLTKQSVVLTVYNSSGGTIDFAASGSMILKTSNNNTNCSSPTGVSIVVNPAGNIAYIYGDLS